MDPRMIGSLICRLRKEQQLTQRQLAEQLCVSDKAVSKWERGLGCPDISLLPDLARLLGIELEGLLSGQLDSNEPLGGNMKNLNFYICPNCGNVVTAMAEAAVSCCGKKLPAPSSEAGLIIAMATVPMQLWETPYKPAISLKQGTIFPCLDKPFYKTGGEFHV